MDDSVRRRARRVSRVRRVSSLPEITFLSSFETTSTIYMYHPSLPLPFIRLRSSRKFHTRARRIYDALDFREHIASQKIRNID